MTMTFPLFFISFFYISIFFYNSFSAASVLFLLFEIFSQRNRIVPSARPAIIKAEIRHRPVNLITRSQTQTLLPFTIKQVPATKFLNIRRILV